MTINGSIKIDHRRIIGMRVDATNYEDATKQVIAWAKAGESRYVCAANVHLTMETYDNEAYAQVISRADLITPDGMPLVWALKLFGVKDATRVYGPTLTLHICEAAAREGVPIGLYGGTNESLAAFVAFLKEKFPTINIACQIAPPFRPLTQEEDEGYTQQIVESGARVLFVGIGCPKQETWMAAHQHRIPAVMLGVGAAFDFHSGRVKQAPSWMQKIGMEWFFRFLMEPRRLAKRYGKHNPRFLFLLSQQLLGLRHYEEIR